MDTAPCIYRSYLRNGFSLSFWIFIFNFLLYLFFFSLLFCLLLFIFSLFCFSCTDLERIFSRVLDFYLHFLLCLLYSPPPLFSLLLFISSLFLFYLHQFGRDLVPLACHNCGLEDRNEEGCVFWKMSRDCQLF